MTDPAKIRVALVGAGRMGRSHLLAARELGFEIVAICDKNKENLHAISENFSIKPIHRFTDFQRMYDADLNIDMVSIATTADSHCQLVVSAAKTGIKSILCEKPMATSVKDCDAMITACKENGTKLAINHQMRFMEQYTLVKNALNYGNLGELASMNVVAGCFGLSMNGSHYIEAFSFLSEDKITEVTAWFSEEEIPNPRGKQFKDQAGQIRATSKSGKRFYLEAGAEQGHGMTVTYATRHGHIFVDELNAHYFGAMRKPEHQDAPVTRYGMPWDQIEGKFRQADNVQPTKAVMQAIIENDQYPSGEDGQHVITVQAAAYKSVAEGNRSINLDELGLYYEKHFPWA